MRYSKWDAVLIALSIAHGALLVVAPSVPVIAIGLWWNANTVSHNFVHLPFFGSRNLNRLYSIYLSLLTGIPQGLWRDRHLAHHAMAAGSLDSYPLQKPVEMGCVLLLWALIAWVSPEFFLACLCPRLHHRSRDLLPPWPLRTRAWRDQPLWPALQSFLLQ